MFFERSYVAATLGFLFGVILIGSYGVISSRFAKKNPQMGLYVSFGVSAIQILVAFPVLLLYRTYAHDGFIWFGGSIAVGFIVGFIYLIGKFSKDIKITRDKLRKDKK